jgi:hypothetical protein
MHEQRTSMLTPGGSSKMKLLDRLKAFDIILSKVGSKSTIERHPLEERIS